ncbi:efflux RND transporter periplasmic adaptor subunit [Parashewanella tropica]|uniref:efflux RND transporter periplasmic adaptor subunit n=1 Tax=Parashewanella tropica TaxID=2547970 RepID=UPI00105960D7|nr:HlyD family efflux transporter periplasmic adaptor subunit [Parashewanella tropica]
MDKKITKTSKFNARRTLMLVGVVAVISVIAWYWTNTSQQGRVQKVNLDNLVVSTVTSGAFSDSLRLRGNIQPKTSLYLDTLVGGRVEEKLVEQGEYVTKGQPLLRLSNTSLQLDVMGREAQVAEQLNFLRNTQMTMETNRLNLKRDLLEIDLQLAHLQRKLKQTRPLVEKGVLAREQLLNLEQDHRYFEQRKLLTLQRQKQEESIRQLQVAQLEDSATMLQTNLKFARQNLANLLVKAPISGYLSDFTIELGESKAAGSRLGQIDIPKSYKLVVRVDEYYLNQVQLGMPARLMVEGQSHELNVSKIDSRVNQSQFQIELDLPKGLTALKRGQSLDIDLMFSSQDQQSLLLSRGAFVNSTGGNWVFVLSPQRDRAIRRNIQLGKKNQQFYQVVSGLKAGERVITSAYNTFDNADTIKVEL